MAIIERVHIGDHGIVGLWHITESVDDLLGLIRFSEGEKETFERFHNKSRQAHWLSYRLAIRQLLGEDRKYEFHYDENGKIHFSNLQYHLSVTHSGDYSAVIISTQYNVGVDIERISERIKKVSQKFLSPSELKKVPFLRKSKYLTAIWSAKEALYKLMNKTDLSFDKNIEVELPKIDKKGKMTGKLMLDDKIFVFDMHYQFYKNYIIVYVIDNQNLIK